MVGVEIETSKMTIVLGGKAAVGLVDWVIKRREILGRIIGEGATCNSGVLCWLMGGCYPGVAMVWELVVVLDGLLSKVLTR